MKIGKYTPSQIRKFAVAGVAAIGTLATSAVETFTTWIPAGWVGPIASGIAFVGAIGVFLTRNAPIIDAADEL
ncbi:hypothetical protein A5733_22075 [Mycobacterium sp. NS-7484]|uniref:hypothetical protein n=1 Tax=Mycobacterium sp. NS-7484 TaxID=1834161 RepID=UPI00096C3986|nr:hypothetical protein [Mycobacterium sp. NS-7484]OMC04165.1 hypothetical protein A5733_22075 [Mycobacterium sp. NS-7484]